MITLHLTFPDSTDVVKSYITKINEFDRVIAIKIKELYKFFVKEKCSLSYNEKKLLVFLQDLESHDKFYISSKSLLRSALKNFSKSSLGNDSTNVKVELFANSSKQTEYIYIWSISDIFEWFVKNRNNQRKYNHHFKHQVNQKSTRIRDGKVVSACEGTINEAKALLPYAVMSSDKLLFAYDTQRCKIMAFRSEDNGTTFHGYHVDRIEPKLVEVIDRLLILHPSNSRGLKKYK